MKKIISSIFIGKRQGSTRKNFVWNMVASAINAAEAVVVLMVATRFAGMKEAGILTISFTVANLMMCIGKYGVRNYQVTDITERKDIRSYFVARVITLLVMSMFTIAFLLYSFLLSHYTLIKGTVVLLTVLIYGIEAFEDVFLSEFQRKGRLDIGTKMFSFRWIVTLVVWCAGIWLFKSVLLPTVLAFTVDLLILVLLTFTISRDLFAEVKKGKDEDDNNKGKIKGDIKKILMDCFPLCVVAVLMIYLPNASKYAIDRYLTDDLQACYGFIAMPVFVIDVVSFIIFQPLLKELAERWAENELKKFVGGIGKLSLFILIFSLCCLTAGYFLGIPVLSRLYAVDLSIYKKEFMILLLAGVAQAYIGMFTAILVIFRKQLFMMLSFLAVSAGTFGVLTVVVPGYGLPGAAITNAAALCILGLILLTGLNIYILCEKGKKENDEK